LDDLRQPTLLNPLTEREIEILRLLYQRLSNREIAQRLTLSVTTVKWYARQIYNKLGVSTRAEAVARAQALKLLEPDESSQENEADFIRPTRHNLPALVTPFIGRDHEISEVKRLLAASRLLTLTGPGGTGKSRLALQVAAECLGDFPDGVFFIALSSLRDSLHVAKAIAEALDVSETEDESLPQALQRTLKDNRTLLLLDNFEHLLEAAPLVLKLLTTAPGLKALVTSRETLHLYGEQEYSVPPLALPDPSEQSSSRLLKNEAIALFVQRAQTASASFQLTDDNASAVVQICRRLDGLPLAIELAAARIKLFEPQALLNRIDSHPGVLVSSALDLPARQQTLHNTIDWSYVLLDPPEQALFCQLAVFRGGCSLDAIEAVCQPGDLDLLAGIESLCDKSLIRRMPAPDGDPRFTMLQTIRDFAKERLEQGGEGRATRRRHAEYFLAQAQQANRELHSSQQIEWLRRLEVEHDNLRAALDWALADRAPLLGLELAGRLGWFWFLRNHAAEGRQRCTLALTKNPDAPPALRSKVLTMLAGRLASNQGDPDAARGMLEEAVDLARASGDWQQMGWASGFLGLNHVRAGRDDLIEPCYVEALRCFEAAGDRFGIGWTQNALGETARMRRDFPRADSHYQNGMAAFKALGNEWGISTTARNIAWTALRLDDLKGAEQNFRAAILGELKLSRGERVAHSLAGMAAIYEKRGSPERAARLLGASEAMLDNASIHLFPVDRLEVSITIDATRARLGEDAFQAAWDIGRGMTLEQAITEAIGAYNKDSVSRMTLI
jgi:predicted ATPase/DNA-binding CsgD family transcriptional regulator